MSEQSSVDNAIVKFIKQHHVLTLSTVSGDQPYCANAFYAYDGERNEFVFTTSDQTQHGQEMALNPRVALSIVLETRVVGRVRGLQITGSALRGDDLARRVYVKAFPYAVALDLSLWRVAPDMMKYTDNTLGFGKKLIWKR